MAKIDVKTLGKTGVILDPNSLDPTVPDDALRSAQNAIHDPTLGYGGALRKRKGFARFSFNGGGAILGGIPMAVAGTGGAPATGGGGTTGTSTGSGDGTGAPGGTNDGGNPVYGNAGGVGAGSFNGGSAIFGGKKLIVIGRTDNLSSLGSGWYITSKGFNDIALLATTPGPPMNGFVPDNVSGSLNRYCAGQAMSGSAQDEGMFARPNGILFYPGRVDPALQSSSGAVGLPTIHRCDGASDAVVATIPVNPLWSFSGQTHGMQIISMCTRFGDGDHIYVMVLDRKGGSETMAGDGIRIYKMSTVDYGLTEVFNSLSTNYNAVTGTGSVLGSGAGQEVWFGTLQQSSSACAPFYSLAAAAGFPDGFADWTGYEGTYADKSDVTCMAIFQNCLFVGHANLAGTPAYAKIVSNSLASGLTLSGGDLTASGGGAVNGNFFVSMCVFNGKLYASYYNHGDTAKIYCFDGTSWSAVFTSSGSGDRVPYNLHTDEDGDILYAYGARETPSNTAHFMTSTDGTTWVDKSSNLTGDLSGSGGGNFTNSLPTNTFKMFAQS